MKKCSRQGRAHHTKSGRLVCVFPRRLESPLRAGGDERECGNSAEGIRLFFSSGLGLGSRSVTFVLLETALSQNHSGTPDQMVHKVAKSPRAELKM